MSINVTVKGNPVSIRHGKMVTASGENAKNEFDKRRKIRLEQVRQQSKEIARDVRNRVRKEKDKQLSQIEQEGARKLKQWQNKKLLQLQEQYDECLKDIGLGHLQASREAEKEEVEELRKETNKQVAKDRGLKAAQQLQAEKNQKSIQKSIANQQKTLARDIENTRAAMVSKLSKTSQKKSKTKKKFKDTLSDSDSNNITLDISATDSDIPLLLNISSSDSSDMRSPKKQARKSSPKAKKPPKAKSPDVSSPSRLSDMSEFQIKSAGVQTEPQSISNIRDVPDTNTASGFPFESRISDRIRSRRLPSDDPFGCCKENVAYTYEKLPNESKIPPSSKRTSDPQYSSATKVNFLEDAKLHPEKYCGLSAPCRANTEVPYKPHTIHLKPIREESGSGLLSTFSGQGKAQYYDHSNRYSREFQPDPSLVQRIPESSVVVGPPDNSEAEFQQMMFKRDQDAIRRGNKALEKEKIQKDYEEMMKKLPILKKQEKIASVGQEKDEFHMSDQRLREKQRQRQNRMSNAYERQFPLSSEITLPRVSHQPKDPPNIAYKTIDLQTEDHGLNVACWDVPRPQTCTPDCPTARSPLGQQADLKVLLDKLREQREKLVNEVENVPLNSDLYKILDELGVLEEIQNKEDTRKSNKRKHEHTDMAESSSSASLDQSKQKTSSSKARSPKRERHKKPKRTSSSATDQPRKHSSFERVLVLQNMSTQTSPKTSIEKAVSPLATSKVDKEVCTCSPKKSTVSDGREELCEIVIKIKEDDAPEIKITSPKKKDGVVKVRRNERKSPQAETPKQTEDDEKSLLIDMGKLSKSYSDIISTLEKGRRISEYVKPSTWGEHLHARDMDMPSTATSYYSPPDAYQPPKDGQNDTSSNSKRRARPKPTNNFAEWMKNKPQQGNISRSTAGSSTPSSVGNKTLDPRLKVYIRKLLKMSPNSIAELSVTSVSDISTPGSSIFENTRNEPVNQLRNVMKFFNLNPEDILGILNESDVSEQASLATPRVEEKTPDLHRQGTERFQPQTTDKFRDVAQQQFFESGMAESRLAEPNVPQKASPLGDVLNMHDSTKDTAAQISLPNESESDARKMTLSDYSSKNYSEVIDKYSEIAENCHRRIMSLEKMINKIRQEKKEMLDTSPRSESDKEISVTAYKELPSHLGEAGSSPDDTDQEHLTRQLLKIDFNLDDQLKKLKEIEKAELKSKSKDESSQAGKLDTSIDRDLLERYKDLLEPRKNGSTDKKDNSNDTIGWLTIPESTFVPFLVNIPRLPKFNVDNQNFPELKPNGTNKKRPPPAKALIVARKFNENIAATQPHELSTIIEADSHLSAKPDQAKIREISPDKEMSKSAYTSSTELETSTSKASSGANSAPEILMELIRNAVQSVQNVSTSSKKKSPRKSRSAPIKVDRPNSSAASSSKSELESVETMLQTLGMGWAVTTLRKTQQALAQTSSTSSLDISVKKVDSSNSSSEISLHGVLQKKIVAKLSSNSSDSDILNLMKEFGDISAIHGSISTGENKHQRTSTPVLASKSTSKSKSNSKLEGLLSGESDISSIKPNEENFASVAVDSNSTILSQND